MRESTNSPKSGVRAHLRSARRTMLAEVRAAADAALIAAIFDLVLAMSARVIAGYVPLPGEPGGAQLLDELSRTGSRLLLPVLLDDLDLDWAEYDGRGRAAAPTTARSPGPPRPCWSRSTRASWSMRCRPSRTIGG